VLITGEKGSGKSLLIQEKILPYLAEKQVDYSGIVMNYVFADDKHIGYKIRLLPGSEEKILVGPDVSDAQLTIGRYAFSASAFDAGTKHTTDLLSKSKLVVLDECGWLESYGLGWYTLMKEIRTRVVPLIVVVRPDLSSDFCQFWNVNPVKELAPDSSDEEVRVAVDGLMR
jgi:nucleoside-triphosphatase THEP1